MLFFLFFVLVHCMVSLCYKLILVNKNLYKYFLLVNAEYSLLALHVVSMVCFKIQYPKNKFLKKKNYNTYFAVFSVDVEIDNSTECVRISSAYFIRK